MEVLTGTSGSSGLQTIRLVRTLKRLNANHCGWNREIVKTTGYATFYFIISALLFHLKENIVT